MANIQSKSKIRINGNVNFIAIKNINTTLLSNYIDRDLKFPLTLDHIYKDVQSYNDLWIELYKTLDLKPQRISVKNTADTTNKLWDFDQIKPD